MIETEMTQKRKVNDLRHLQPPDWMRQNQVFCTPRRLSVFSVVRVENKS